MRLEPSRALGGAAEAWPPWLVAQSKGPLVWQTFQSAFDFLIIAAAIFMALKAINKLKAPPPPPAAAPPPADVQLLTEIRDLLKK